MPTLFNDVDVGLGGQPSSGLMSDADVGINAGDMPGEIRIPLPGGGSFKPSLIGAVKGLWEAGKSAATLPGDVYAGKVDPMSEEGIRRAAELASMTVLPSAGRTLATRAIETPTVSELQTAARPTYKELTATGNAELPLPGKTIASDIESNLHPQALRESNAPRTYNEIGRLSKAEDINDIAIARDKLRDVANGISDNRLIRVSGNDSTAARHAMQQLDAKLEELSPGWTQKMAEADANWAASKRMETVTKEADKGQKGRLGSFDTNTTRAKGYTPEEISAIKRAHQGGTTGAFLNAVGGGLNPFHGGLPGAISAAAHLPAAVATGGKTLIGVPVGIAADALAKMVRQRALNQALAKLASRSPLGQQRALANRPFAMTPLGLPPPTTGLLPLEGSQ